MLFLCAYKEFFGDKIWKHLGSCEKARYPQVLLATLILVVLEEI